MRKCPECNRVYSDESLNYCLEDGATLITPVEPDTALLPRSIPASEAATRTQRSGETAEPARPFGNAALTGFSTRRWIIAALIVVAFAGIGYFTYKYFARDATGPQAIDSVAVLPFVNKTGNPDSEYLADGLSESLVYRLSQVPDLKVSPPSTVARYENTNVDPVQAGKELGVSAVVLGKIVERDGNLTISAELIDVRQNKLLWGEQFDRKMSDLLVTQREIAREIMENLSLKVTGSERGLAKHYTESNEAYQLYLRARYHWNKRNAESGNKALEYFKQAIEEDPKFALAYSGIADAYTVPSVGLAPHDSMPKAKAAALRALELDESLAEAHTSLARILAAYDWDWAGAEREFKRAIELNPRYAVAHEWYGLYLAAIGRVDDSLAERRLALELDPLSPNVNFELGQSLFWRRDYERAIEQFNKTLDLDPSLAAIYAYLSVAYERAGHLDDAIAVCQKIPAKQGNEWAITMGELGRLYAKTGRQDEARKLIEQLKQASASQYVPAPAFALIYLSLGEKDETFIWMQKGIEQRAFQLQWIKVDPRWDDIRSDPRYDELVRKMGLAG